MRRIEVSLPDKVAADAEKALTMGWFASLDDLIRAALVEYLDEHKMLLQEEQQLADVDWAKSLGDQKRAG